MQAGGRSDGRRRPSSCGMQAQWVAKVNNECWAPLSEQLWMRGGVRERLPAHY